MAEPDRYAFGEFALDIPRRSLQRGDTPVRIGGRALDLLIALVRRRGQLVTKRELVSEIWPRIVVEENNLTTQVASLRRLLGESREQVFIATDTGRGYRFVAPLVIGEPDSSPAIGAPPNALRDTLPRLAAPLIGREDLLAALRGRLETRRMVTLVGAGGIGKTRVAIEIAHEWPDGALYVDFEAGEREAVQTLCGVLGATPGPDPDSTASSIVTALRAWPAPPLIVLDTCEAGSDELPVLVTLLLRKSPALRILAAGQEKLGVPGEVVMPVAPLECPGTTGDPRLSAAYRLLADRAGEATGIPWTPSGQDMQAAAALCRAVDGLPLALIMAASQLHVSRPGEVLARLGTSARILSGGPRDAPERQKSLRASLDWSHARLTGAEQAVLRYLSAFPSSFDLDGATAVARDCGGVHPQDLFDIIGGLVAKSLVEADGSGPRMRYRMLHMTRLYAGSKLADDPPGQTCLAVARNWILSRARELHAAYGQMPRDGYLARFGPEMGNISALIAQNLCLRDGPAARALIALAAPLMEAMGLTRDLRDWAAAAASLPEGEGEDERTRRQVDAHAAAL